MRYSKAQEFESECDNQAHEEDPSCWVRMSQFCNELCTHFLMVLLRTLNSETTFAHLDNNHKRTASAEHKMIWKPNPYLYN